MIHILPEKDLIEIILYAKQNYIYNFNVTHLYFNTLNETLFSSFILYDNTLSKYFKFETLKGGKTGKHKDVEVETYKEKINSFIRIFIPIFSKKYCLDVDGDNNWEIGYSKAHYDICIGIFDKLLKHYNYDSKMEN